MNGAHFRVPMLLRQEEGHIERTVIGEVRSNTAQSAKLRMRGDSKRESREIPSASGAKPHGGSLLERRTNLSEGNVSMNAFGKSDDFVVLSTQMNNAATALAESVEVRRSPKESLAELSPMHWTPRRMEHQLEWHGNHDWRRNFRDRLT